MWMKIIIINSIQILKIWWAARDMVAQMTRAIQRLLLQTILNQIIISSIANSINLKILLTIKAKLEIVEFIIEKMMKMVRIVNITLIKEISLILRVWILLALMISLSLRNQRPLKSFLKKKSQKEKTEVVEL